MSAITAITSSKSTNVRPPLIARLMGLGLSIVDRVSPRLGARLAGRLFCTPRRPARPASESQWYAAAKRSEMLIAGFPVVVSSWGEGPTVLLVHGWEGRATQLGAFSESLVSRGYRVVAPDFPAHGDSRGKQTNLLEFVAVISGLINELAPQALIAHSFGAAATTVALKDMTFTGSLVYIAPPDDFSYFIEKFSAMLGVSLDLGTRMQRDLERRFEIDWSELRGAVLARRMTAPLQVIHDEDDPDVPARFGRSIAAVWPDARLIVTRGLGHRRILRDAEVVEAATDFIVAA